MGFLGVINKNSAKIQSSLSSIVKFILFLSIINAVYAQLWNIFVADILLLFLIFTPLFLKESSKILIPREFEIGIMFFAIASFFLGEVRGIIIHGFFGLLIGFIGFAIMVILYSNSKIKINYFFVTLFACSTSIAFVAVLMVAKFFLKAILNYETRLADYIYAMNGILMVTVGSLFSSFFGYLYMEKYRVKAVNFLVKRFKQKNPNLFIKRVDSPEEILKLIKEGERKKIEFKQTLRTNIHTNSFDKKMEHAVLKSITSFLNSEGGTLLVGVTDTGEISGIEKDNFESLDKFNLHFANLVKSKIGNKFIPYLNFELILIEGKNVLKVDCFKSNSPVFLKEDDNTEGFYVRVGPSSVQLKGSELIDYVKNNFEKVQ